MLHSRLFLWALLFALLLRPVTAYSKDNSKPAEASVAAAKDFDPAAVRTVRMPDRPEGDRRRYEQEVFDGVRRKIEEAGYKVEVGSTKEYAESEAKLALQTTLTKGKSVQEALEKAKKNSEDASDAEKYSLQVSIKLTVQEGKKPKEVYSAFCKMWHEYTISKTWALHDVQITPTSPTTGRLRGKLHYPITYSGRGPNTLEKAIPEMCAILTNKLPTRK